MLILALNMQLAIISYLVYNRLTHDKLSLGLLGLWEVIPAIGCSFFSGHFVDISEKKGMVLKCVLGYLLLSLFFTLLSFPAFYNKLGISHTVFLIYFGIFIGGVLRAFVSPAAFALLGLLVPRKEYPNASTWSSTAWQIGAVIGPLLAGGMIAVSGFTVSLATVFAIELISLVGIILIPKQEIHKKDKEPIVKSLKQGLKFVYKTQIIFAALSLDMFAVLFGGAVALLPVYADDILKVGEIGYGWMRAAPGIGSIITLFILSFIPLKRKPGIKLLLAIIGFGITTIIFGLCGDIATTGFFGTIWGCRISWAFLLAFLMLLLGGMFDAVSVVIRGTILQTETPGEMRGRVAAVSTMFISSSNELGAMESGLTAKWMGTVPAVVFGGCMTLVVVGTTYFAAPLLRRMKLDTSDSKENKT
jgi:MFS family permease